MLRDLGADAFYDYGKTNVEDVLTDLDLVVDAVGGPTSSRFLKTLKRGGALFPVFGLGFDDKGGPRGSALPCRRPKSIRTARNWPRSRPCWTTARYAS
jgi:NADPH:quinone reductase-like Zn-dependent oxidoreductase